MLELVFLVGLVVIGAAAMVAIALGRSFRGETTTKGVRIETRQSSKPGPGGRKPRRKKPE
jgi:hypothetical protein